MTQTTDTQTATHTLTTTTTTTTTSSSSSPERTQRTVDAAYLRRARQLRHLITALREGLDVLEGELAAGDEDSYAHGADEVGDMAILADTLIEAVAALRQDVFDDLERELVGD